MDVFDIIGPVMIGPSSSHTAGAARIGLMARQILAEAPESAEIRLFGSFARTGRGHGTDKALVGGLLGMQADDVRIPQSLEIAAALGMRVRITCENAPGGHPNTAAITARGRSGRLVEITGCSVGGGAIVIRRIGRYEVALTGEYPALIVPHRDTPGAVANVSGILAREGINIARMRVSRSDRGGEAMMVIETDQPVDDPALRALRRTDGILDVMKVDRL